jgi:D-alanyl-D-alanine carboxypeptidase
MSDNMKLIDAIMNGDAAASREAFTAAITDKMNTVLDIRRVTMASDVFNQVQEGAMKKEILNPNFVKDLPEEEDQDELEEATKPGSKIIITQGKHKGENARIGEINRGRFKGDESYIIDLAGGSNIQLRRGAFKLVLNKSVNEDDLEEAQTPGQKFDFQKVLHGAMRQDEYNKKYKLGKYRPAGNKLTGPGGIYKNLVKNP